MVVGVYVCGKEEGRGEEEGGSEWNERRNHALRWSWWWLGIVPREVRVCVRVCVCVCDRGDPVSICYGEANVQDGEGERLHTSCNARLSSRTRSAFVLGGVYGRA
jgi:hypothetical protein